MFWKRITARHSLLKTQQKSAWQIAKHWNFSTALGVDVANYSWRSGNRGDQGLVMSPLFTNRKDSQEWVTQFDHSQRRRAFAHTEGSKLLCLTLT